MTRATQGLLMAFLGAVLVRISVTDVYLRYVTEWMRWPLLVSGVLLVLLAVGLVLDRGHDGHDREHDGERDGGHGHGVPLVTWLLLVPGLVVFVVSPPQLGAFIAERRSGEAVTVTEPSSLSDLETTESGQPVRVDLTELLWRAQEGGQSLEGRTLAVEGFVSYDRDGGWYVTRMTIGCCAADAIAHQVRVTGAERPERDQWVAVTGVHEEGTGADGIEPPVLAASEVVEIATPAQTYE